MSRNFLRSNQWRERIRPQQLNKEPLCEWCKALDTVAIADHVDHVIRPDGDYLLERDSANLQSLCHAHHSVKTNWEKRGSKGAITVGYGTDGYPVLWSIAKGLHN